MQRTISNSIRPPGPYSSAPVAAHDAPTGDLLRTRSGIELVLRPIQPSDAPALVRAFSHLTPEQVRMRLFANLSALPLEMAQQLCDVNAERVAAFVVTKPGEIDILAEARIVADRSASLAEFAIVVHPDWTSIGIAHALMTRLIEESRRRGLIEIWGDILTDNRPMLDLIQRLGFERQSRADDRGVIRASLAL